MCSRLINYGISFDDIKLKREDYIFIRSILTNSRFKIDMNYNFEILVGLILYITNCKVLVPIEYKEVKDVIYFYAIQEPENKITLD